MASYGRKRFKKLEQKILNLEFGIDYLQDPINVSRRSLQRDTINFAKLCRELNISYATFMSQWRKMGFMSKNYGDKLEKLLNDYELQKRQTN